MAKKDVNPVEAARKAERRKEAAKNKRTRDAVRAAVAATKDPSELLAELNRVKKAPPPAHMGKEAIQTHAHRVARLEKEYAICVERQAAREAEARSRPKVEIDMTGITGGAVSGSSASAAPVTRAQQRPKEDSVYFHPIKNPWARPPHGQPQRWVDGSIGGTVIGDPEAEDESDSDEEEEEDELEGADDAAHPTPLLPTPSASHGPLLPTPATSGMKRPRDDIPPPPPPPVARPTLLHPPPPPPIPQPGTLPGLPATGGPAAAWMQPHMMAYYAAMVAAAAAAGVGRGPEPVAVRQGMKRPRVEGVGDDDPMALQDAEGAAIEARLTALRASMATEAGARPASAPQPARPAATPMARPLLVAAPAPAIKASVVAMRPTHVKPRPVGAEAPRAVPLQVATPAATGPVVAASAAQPSTAAVTSSIMRSAIGPSGARLLQRPAVAPAPAAATVTARPAAAASTVRSAAAPAPAPSMSASDAYDDFMKEIGGLIS